MLFYWLEGDLKITIIKLLGKGWIWAAVFPTKKK